MSVSVSVVVYLFRYLDLLDGYRVALEEGVALSEDLVGKITWILRSFSDYFVPPPNSVARSAARRAHKLAKTIPDLSEMAGQPLCDFLKEVCGCLCSGQ